MAHESSTWVIYPQAIWSGFKFEFKFKLVWVWVVKINSGVIYDGLSDYKTTDLDSMLIQFIFKYYYNN